MQVAINAAPNYSPEVHLFSLSKLQLVSYFVIPKSAFPTKYIKMVTLRKIFATFDQCEKKRNNAHCGARVTPLHITKT